jgi:transcriptional regulator with XRE-family HTH domain
VTTAKRKRGRGPNERLRQAMDQAGYTIEDLAEAAQFHPKQVGRWLSEGVVPRRVGAKTLVAGLLDVGEADIWPPDPEPEDRGEPVTADLVDAWAQRADVPRERWWRLLAGAERQLDLVAWSLAFLRDDHPRLHDLLGDKLAAGCRIRVVTGDPVSRAVCDRDAEEGLGGHLAPRIARDLAALGDDPRLVGLGLRTHRQCLTASVFRADDELFSTPHLFGLPDPATPLLHLRRRRDGGLFDAAVGHVDRVWELADPVDAGRPGPGLRAWVPMPDWLPSAAH